MTENIQAIQIPSNVESTAKLMTHTIMRVGHMQVQEYWAELAAAKAGKTTAPVVAPVDQVALPVTDQANVVQLRPNKEKAS